MILTVMDFMNLQTISNTTFLKQRQDYLQPAANEVVEKVAMISKINKEDRRLIIGGDTQSDSPIQKVVPMNQELRFTIKAHCSL